MKKEITMGVRLPAEIRDCLKVRSQSLGYNLSNVLRAAAVSLLAMTREEFDDFVETGLEVEREYNLTTGAFDPGRWAGDYETIEKGITKGIVSRSYRHYPVLDGLIAGLVRKAQQEDGDVEGVKAEIEVQSEHYQEHMNRVFGK